MMVSLPYRPKHQQQQQKKKKLHQEEVVAAKRRSLLLYRFRDIIEKYSPEAERPGNTTATSLPSSSPSPSLASIKKKKAPSVHELRLRQRKALQAMKQTVFFDDAVSIENEYKALIASVPQS